jgi:di/tricarboxylate transporter
VLKPGDVLLLEAHPQFLHKHRNDGNFALMSEVEGSEPPRHEKAWVSLAILAALVTSNVAGWLSLLDASLIAAGAMVLARCVTGAQARQAVDLQVLVSVAASFGVAAALESSGAAAGLGAFLVDLAIPLGQGGVLAAIYIVTALITNVVTNNAAAALMFPIATAAAEAAGMDIRACMLLLMLAASASFATPIGYQTNLMVLGPGGYRFADFFRIGIPLQIVVGVVGIVATQFMPR